MVRPPTDRVSTRDVVCTVGGDCGTSLGVPSETSELTEARLLARLLSAGLPTTHRPHDNNWQFSGNRPPLFPAKTPSQSRPEKAWLLDTATERHLPYKITQCHKGWHLNSSRPNCWFYCSPKTHTIITTTQLPTPSGTGTNRSSSAELGTAQTHQTITKRLKSLNGTPISELRSVTCHMGSHSVSCHPTQTPAKYSIYNLPTPEGWKAELTYSSRLVTYRDGLPVHRQSRIKVLTRPSVQ